MKANDNNRKKISNALKVVIASLAALTIFITIVIEVIS